MHFALYGAARSSPALRAFDGGNLDKQLEQATAEHLQRTVRVEQGGAVVVVPKVFDWYARDFGGERGSLEFALGRLDEAAVDAVDRRQGRVKLQYTEYDWALNRR